MGSDVQGGGKFQRTSAHSSKATEEKEQNSRIKELIEANTNWQNYNKQRDAYVEQLQEEAKLKDAKISQLQMQLDQANQKYQRLEESRTQLEKDKEHLAGQLQNAKEENQELTRRLDEGSASNSELLHLEEQVKAYKEDFESERKDRERAQSRLANVEMELEIVRRELRQYNLREMQDLQQRRQASLDYHRQEYLRKNPQSVYQSDHFEERNPEDGEDEIDG